MDERALAAIAALDDDVRRALYEYARTAPGEVTREDAARATGISRNLAAFHLDKLVDLGLLEVHPARRAAGRVGRAPKCYRPAQAAVVVSVPPRAPQLLAEILAAAVVTERRGERAREAATRVARERGEEFGKAERDRLRPGRLGLERAMSIAVGALAAQGFEPDRDGAAIQLRNCPFHPLAATEPVLVCGINHAYLEGMLDGLNASGSLSAVLAPREGRCCVQLRRR